MLAAAGLGRDRPHAPAVPGLQVEGGRHVFPVGRFGGVLLALPQLRPIGHVAAFRQGFLDRLLVEIVAGRLLSRKTDSLSLSVGRSFTLSGIPLGRCQMHSQRSSQPSSWRAKAARQGIPRSCLAHRVSPMFSHRLPSLRNTRFTSRNTLTSFAVYSSGVGSLPISRGLWGWSSGR